VSFVTVNQLVFTEFAIFSSVNFTLIVYVRNRLHCLCVLFNVMPRM